MTVEELTVRFPEIPRDLHDEPVLADFAARLDPYLRAALKPSACASSHTPENRCYLKLVGPMDIYRYGLSTKEKVAAQLRALIEEYERDPAAFRKSVEDGA